MRLLREKKRGQDNVERWKCARNLFRLVCEGKGRGMKGNEDKDKDKEDIDEDGNEDDIDVIKRRKTFTR